MKRKVVITILLIAMIFMPKMVFATNTYDRLHFIKDASFGGDAIVIESNGHFGLIDTMNPGDSSEFKDIAPNWNDSVDNGTKVYNYVYGLMSSSSRKKLDFLILSHNHSDHIGGVSEIKDLIDDKTVVFYKEDIMPVNDVQDTGNESYHNHDYYLAAMQVLNNKNAVLVNTATASTLSNLCSDCFVDSIQKGTSSTPSYQTNLKDYLSFDFGDFSIDLYNLYTLSNHMENLNSIVTLVTHKTSNKRAMLMADQETARGDIDYEVAWLENGQPRENRIENPLGCGCTASDSNCKCALLGIENQIADIVGEVEILKAGHHGHGATYNLSSTGTSNSYYMLNKFRPENFIVTYVHGTDGTNIYPDGGAVGAILYMKQKYNTDSYYTSQSEGAVVVEFTTNNYVIKNFDSVGSETIVTMHPMGTYAPDGWYYMYNEIAHHFSEDFTRNLKMVYVYNNSLHINDWRFNTDKWYYFGNDGIAQEGLVKVGKYYYYFTTPDEIDSDNPIASMMTPGWKKIDGYWYYFRRFENDISTGAVGSAVTGLATINSQIYYFRTVTNDISTGPEASMIKGLSNINGDIYYFRNAKDEVSTGPEGSALKDGCITIGNTEYCFGSNGIMTNSTTYISIPTNAKCNSLTYTGNTQTLTKTADEGYIWSNNLKTDAGSYDVVATLESGYKWSDNSSYDKLITCSISKRQLPKPTMGNTIYTYTGNSITPTISDYDSNTMSLTGVSSTINAGNFSATVSIKDTNNNEWADGTNSSIIYNWVVNKANRNAPVVTSYIGTYDSNPHTITVSGEGTFEYSLDQVSWIMSKPRRTKVGVTTVYVRTQEEANYNASSIASGTIEIELVGTYIIEGYSVDSNDNTISGIIADTSLEQFTNNIILGTGYSAIVDYNLVDNTKLIYTGGITKVFYDESIVIEYTNIVSGDPSGDGLINSADLLRLRQHLLNINTLSGVYFTAGDVNYDNTINSADLLRTRQHLLGIQPIY